MKKRIEITILTMTMFVAAIVCIFKTSTEVSAAIANFVIEAVPGEGYNKTTDSKYPLYPVYDLTTKLTIAGYDTAGYEAGWTYRINSLNYETGLVDSVPVANHSSFEEVRAYGEVLDISGDLEGMPDGYYYVMLTVWAEVDDGSGRDQDTGRMLINYRTVNANVEIEGDYGKYNPDSLTVGSNRVDATNAWKITNKNGTVIENGVGQVPDSVLESLAEGEYTLTNTATLTTKYGNQVADTAEATFIIRHPESTTSIDKTWNPTLVTGTKKIADSTLSWELKDNTGNTVTSGNGGSVPSAILEGLEAGNYTIYFTETSPEEETHTSNGQFRVRHPESTTTVDKAINPTSITGTKTITESTLSWELKDNTGNTVTVGAGDSVPSAILEGLESGEYTVAFIETSPEGETHRSNGQFTIRHPKSTTNIDKAYNPTSITGTKTIVDSTLSWQLKDNKGEIIASGDGDSVPSAILEGLESGEYTVAFIETSPEGETHKSNGKFTIRHPESTTTIDKEINPTSITGTKTITESTLSWQLEDNKGEIIASGDGDSVPSAILEGLEVGKYSVSFIETSPEGETHTSNGKFTIRHPKSTTTIDKEVDPKSITGTKTIDDSTLSWQIKDSNGNIVASGDGDSVPSAILEGLESGEYTVAFIETSPEGETHTSGGEFTISKSPIIEGPKEESPINPQNPKENVTQKNPKKGYNNTNIPVTGDQTVTMQYLFSIMAILTGGFFVNLKKKNNL